MRWKRRHPFRGHPHLLGRRSHLLELPAGLDRAHRAQRLGAVPQPVPGQAPLVAEVPRRGQHIQLEPDQGTVVHAAAGQRRRQPRQRAQRLDQLQRRLLPCPLQRAPHQQPRPARRRHDQVRLLIGAGQVGEVGALDDHGGIQPARREGCLEPREPPLNLLSRYHAA